MCLTRMRHHKSKRSLFKVFGFLDKEGVPPQLLEIFFRAYLTSQITLVISPVQSRINFHDSRLNSIEVFWVENDRSFKDVVRAAVLDTVPGLSGE
jgi:hypothetical protein